MEIKEVAVMAAKEAGQILLEYIGNVAIEFKQIEFSVVSIVTEADKQSENTIVSLIKKNFPDHGIYGEEGTSDNLSAEYVWYIDPLDGTSNFTRNIPLFGISIGVVRNGQPICGVLFFPMLNLLVEAESGKGALANGKRINVSKRPINQAFYYSGGKYKGVVQTHHGLANACAMLKIIDASSYEFAQIAMGDAEVYFLKNVPHDVVAGVCIIREAGGVIMDGRGEDWSLSSEGILATTPTLQAEIISILKNSSNIVH